MELRVATLCIALSLVGATARADQAEADCQVVPENDYSPLLQAAEEDGTLSKALAQVTSYCFDANNNWTGGRGGVYLQRGQTASTDPVDQCAGAIDLCNQAADVVNKNYVAHDSGAAALGEMQSASYHGQSFTVRPDLLNTVDGSYSCTSRDYASLMDAAKRRMAIGQLHYQIQRAYVSYTMWLHSTRIGCINDDRRAAAAAQLKAAQDRQAQIDAQRAQEQQQRLAQALRQREEAQRQAQQAAQGRTTTQIDPGPASGPQPGNYKIGGPTTPAPAQSVAAQRAAAQAAAARQRLAAVRAQSQQAIADAQMHAERARDAIANGSDGTNEQLQSQMSSIRGAAAARGNTRAANIIGANQARLAATSNAISAGVGALGNVFAASARAAAARREEAEAEEERREAREEAREQEQRIADQQRAQLEAQERAAIAQQQQAEAQIAAAEHEARVAEHMAVSATLKTGSAPTSQEPARLEWRQVDADRTAQNGVVLRPMGAVAERTLVVRASRPCRLRVSPSSVQIVANVPVSLPAGLTEVRIRSSCAASVEVRAADGEPVSTELPANTPIHVRIPLAQ